MSKELRVKNALKKDAGKYIVRIDPILMKELNLKSTFYPLNKIILRNLY